MTEHWLKATCETVHLGGFSAALKPALVVESGDRIHVETFSGYGVYRQAPDQFVPPAFRTICEQLPSDRKVGPGSHLLTGPIYVNHAEPGDMLEVRLEAISPGVPMGFNAIRSGWGVLSDIFTAPALRFIPLDLANQVAEFPPDSGINIPLQPFFGILGVATDETRSSIPPGCYGGNIDNRQLQAGTRLFLPIFLPGAMFSIGDGHAAQGDGEVNVTAIETSMKGTIQLILHKDLQLTAPFAETATDFIVMGFGTTLDIALENALQHAIEFLKLYAQLSAEAAYVLCSLAVNFHITQAVNTPQKGVHGMISKSIFSRSISLM